MHGRAQVVSRLEELEPAGLGLSITSLAELYEGIFGSYDLEATEIALWNVLHRIHVVPLDEDIRRAFARERNRLRAAGTLISEFDLMIRSHSHKLTGSRYSPTIAGILSVWMVYSSSRRNVGVQLGNLVSE